MLIFLNIYISIYINMDISNQFQRRFEDFSDLKKEVDKEVIIAQEIERLGYNNTYKIFINSRIGTDRAAGAAHNDFNFRLPTIPGVENCDCVCRIRAVYLPTFLQTGNQGNATTGSHNANQGFGNICKVYTNFLKPQQYNTFVARLPDATPYLSGDLLGIVNITQKVFDVTLNQGVTNSATFLRQRIDGLIEPGDATSQPAPYYALYSNGSLFNGGLVGSDEPTVNAEQPSVPTNAGTGEIDKSSAAAGAIARQRYFKMDVVGEVTTTPQPTSALPAGQQMFSIRNDGVMTQKAVGTVIAAQDVVAALPGAQAVLPFIHNIIPAFNAFGYQKRVKGYVGKPLSNDWIPCKNPFGQTINIKLKRPNIEGTGLQVEQPLDVGTSNNCQVEMELEIKFLPNYRSFGR